MQNAKLSIENSMENSRLVVLETTEIDGFDSTNKPA